MNKYYYLFTEKLAVTRSYRKTTIIGVLVLIRFQNVAIVTIQLILSRNRHCSREKYYVYFVHGYRVRDRKLKYILL